jgi:hypothetical protein
MFVSLEQIRDAEDGKALYEVGMRLGAPGTPVINGRLYLEHNADLSQLQAVGLGTPGDFYKVANHHAAASQLARRSKDISSAQWSITKPTLPEYEQGNPVAQALLDVQWEACQRQWHKWLTPEGKDPRVLSQWIREALHEVPVAGFVSYELVAEPEVVPFACDGETRALILLTLPEYRAPYTVEQWVTYRGQFAGVVLRCVNDSTSGRYEDVNVLLPAEKCVLVARNRVGGNFAGVSEMRSIANLAQISWGLHEEEVTGLERHASGDLLVHVHENTSLGAEERSTILDIIESRRDGRKTGGGLFPPGVEAEVVSPQNQLPDFSGPIDRVEGSMFKALGAEHRTMAAGGGPGSYAAREAAEGESSRERNDDALQFVVEPLRVALARMLTWSGLAPGGRLYLPEFTSTPLNARVNPAQQVGLLAQAVPAGLVPWDVETDGRKLLEALGWK